MLVARLTVECQKLLNRLFLQTCFPWVFAYHARTQFSVPCRQNINLCQYWLSQITFYGGAVIPKQPAIMRQALKDEGNKYESVFLFIPWPPINFHINRGDFLLKISGGRVHGPGPWGGPWTPVYVMYVHIFESPVITDRQQLKRKVDNIEISFHDQLQFWRPINFSADFYNL